MTIIFFRRLSAGRFSKLVTCPPLEARLGKDYAVRLLPPAGRHRTPGVYRDLRRYVKLQLVEASHRMLRRRQIQTSLNLQVVQLFAAAEDPSACSGGWDAHRPCSPHDSSLERDDADLYAAIVVPRGTCRWSLKHKSCPVASLGGCGRATASHFLHLDHPDKRFSLRRLPTSSVETM